MNQISEVFPDAKFVHLLRDGTDVAASFINAGLLAPRVRLTLEISRRGGPPLHARASLSLHRNSLRRLGESTYFFGLRYMRLPVFSLRFLDSRDGITSGENMEEVSKLQFHENVFEPVSSESVGKGHRRLSKKQKAEIQNLIGRELKCYGYATP
jgi:hypothetical protein